MRIIGCIGVSIPPQRHHPLFLAKPPPLFRQSPPSILVFREPHLSLWSLCPLFFIFFFQQMIALQTLWKMFFISFKKLFSFSRYSNFCIFVFSSFFFLVSHYLRGWSKKTLKIYHVINCLNKNLITDFFLYLEKQRRRDIETLSIDRELNKKHFYRKIMQKMCTKS